MGVIAFNREFYCTATALLIEDFNFQVGQTHEEYIELRLNLANQLVDSNWGYFAQRYNEDLSAEINEIKKKLRSITVGYNFTQYLKLSMIDKLLHNLSIFAYNSDENPEIYRILYLLYKSALFKKEFLLNE